MWQGSLLIRSNSGERSKRGRGFPTALSPWLLWMSCHTGSTCGSIRAWLDRGRKLWATCDLHEPTKAVRQASRSKESAKVHSFLKQCCARTSVYRNKVLAYYSWLIGFVKSTLFWGNCDLGHCFEFINDIKKISFVHPHFQRQKSLLLFTMY
jgi:hypothetical protein